MGIELRLILVVILLVGAFLICRKLYYDKKRLDATIEGRKTRKEKSSFSLEQYIEDKQYCKNQKWLFQKNKGIILRKRIVARDYSKGCNLIIKQRSCLDDKSC